MMKEAAIPLLVLGAALSPCTAMTQGDALPGDVAVEVLDALPAAQRAILDEKVDLFLRTMEQSKTILGGIKDKETADAAAPQLAELADAFEAGFPDWEGMPDELSNILQLSLLRHLAKAQEVDDMVCALARLEPPFYGSEALAGVFTVAEGTDSPEAAQGAGVSPEQLQEACRLMDEYLAAVDKTINLLDGIEDKETADAAAPGVEALMHTCEATWEALQVWMEAQADPEELDDMLMERYEDRLEAVREMDALLLRLEDRDPAFYGSSALENAILGAPFDDEGEDIDDEEPEPEDEES